MASDPIVLEGELTIYTAAETFARLRPRVSGCSACVLDLSRVVELDSAGLQLILWLKLAVEARGAVFELAAFSEPVGQVIGLLQLRRQLGIEGDDAEEGP